MNQMTDLVFNSILTTCPDALVIGSSSVHATGGAYFPFTKEPYSTIAKRKFKNLKEWPKPLSVLTEPCPTGDYGLEKAYVESWCSRFGAIGKTLGQVFGHVDHEGGAGRFLPQGEFSPMLFFAEVPTVIGPEHNDGVGCMRAFLQCVKHAPNLFIGEGNGSQVTVHGLLPLVVFAHLGVVPLRLGHL